MKKSLAAMFLWIGGTLVASSAPSLPPAVQNWIDFEAAVRDGLTQKEISREQLPSIMKGLKEWARSQPMTDPRPWVFPLKGYGMDSIGGNRGNGYLPDIVYGSSPIKGYDFFDGNRHGGHPAQDIFIRDADRDSLDDHTKQPVQVLSMVDAVVIGTYDEWVPGNRLRGGNVVWLYSHVQERVFYYAHLKEIQVHPGEFVKAGQSIGTVGRTGFSAQEPRSPTHLHLMALKFNGQTLEPFNIYGFLGPDSPSEDGERNKGGGMYSFTIILHPLPERRDALIDASLAVIAPSRAEPGCLFFDLLAGEGDEVVFYEAYVDEAAFRAHMAAPYTRQWQERALPLVDRSRIRFPAHRGISR